MKKILNIIGNWIIVPFVLTVITLSTLSSCATTIQLEELREARHQRNLAIIRQDTIIPPPVNLPRPGYFNSYNPYYYNNFYRPRRVIIRTSANRYVVPFRRRNKTRTNDRNTYRNNRTTTNNRNNKTLRTPSDRRN